MYDTVCSGFKIFCSITLSDAFSEFMIFLKLVFFLFFSMNMDCGVFGGWPYLAYQYVKRVVCCTTRLTPVSFLFPIPPFQGGIDSDYAFPYCSGDGKCFPCVAPGIYTYI